VAGTIKVIAIKEDLTKTTLTTGSFKILNKGGSNAAFDLDSVAVQKISYGHSELNSSIALDYLNNTVILNLDVSGYDLLKTTFKIESLEIKRVNVITYKNKNKNEIYDYACCINDADSNRTLADFTVGDMPSSKYFTLSVSDSRVNHIRKNWKVEQSDDPKVYDENALNYENPNQVAEPTDVDWEYDVNFETGSSTYSTAYIRNAPMQSLWELGCIHLGEVNRTLDLLDVDAEILDQVKIGPQKYQNGKIYITESNIGLLNFLKEKVTLPSYGYEIAAQSKSDVFHMETSTYNDLFTVINSDLFKKRSELSKIFKKEYESGSTNLVTDLKKISDREREMFWGVTANLCSVRMKKYTIITVSDMLKDVNKMPDDVFDDQVMNPMTVDGRKVDLLSRMILITNVVYDQWTKKLTIVSRQTIEE